jgi:hypothetical protein
MVLALFQHFDTKNRRKPCRLCMKMPHSVNTTVHDKVFLSVIPEKNSDEVGAKSNNRVHFGFAICALNFGEKE